MGLYISCMYVKSVILARCLSSPSKNCPWKSVSHIFSLSLQKTKIQQNETPTAIYWLMLNNHFINFNWNYEYGRRHGNWVIFTVNWINGTRMLHLLTLITVVSIIPFDQCSCRKEQMSSIKTVNFNCLCFHFMYPFWCMEKGNNQLLNSLCRFFFSSLCIFKFSVLF